MNACIECQKTVEKDARRVESGKDYVCAICLADMAHEAERLSDSMPTPPKRKRKNRRDRTPRGSQVSLGEYDFSKMTKRKKHESAEEHESSLQTEGDG